MEMVKTTSRITTSTVFVNIDVFRFGCTAMASFPGNLPKYEKIVVHVSVHFLAKFWADHVLVSENLLVLTRCTSMLVVRFFGLHVHVSGREGMIFIYDTSNIIYDTSNIIYDLSNMVSYMIYHISYIIYDIYI
jgi:hypothetical protein